MIATWRPHSTITSYECDVLATDAEYAHGECVAVVEDFGYAAYPSARNARTGNLERGGPHRDRAEARLWAERVAGLHPTKSGDEREPFYYEGSASA